MSELLAWSVHLNHQGNQPTTEQETSFTPDIQFMNHQNAVIAQLIEENKTQARRITELEKRMSGGVTISSADTRQVSQTTLGVDSSTINNV
ncbi:hypothetical protein L917_12078, partial [Phytophthora nicotianae]